MSFTLLKEPPFRLIAAALVKRLSRSLRAQELWDANPRPQYLTGVLRGADQAMRENRGEISVIEFGVASGQGLLALQAIAEAVEAETSVRIHVYGFDTGTGLTPPGGGYRDHADRWQEGDYYMPDQDLLRKRMTSRSELVLGDVAETVTDFVNKVQKHPVGFVAFDLDYYSSTMHALNVFAAENRNMLTHVPLYFDDTSFFGAGPHAGELLAIEEFNAEPYPVKISKWQALKYNRPFFERRWLDAMYVASNIELMAKPIDASREKEVLPM